MEIATIHATKREGLGTRAARRLRRQGEVPVVLYGRQRETVSLSVPRKELEAALAAGSRMLSIEVGGAQETAILKDLQYDSMGDELIHADLSRIAMDEKVTVRVPVELHGTAKGALSGGTLDHIVQDIEVTCLPADMPDKVRVEIGHLEIGQVLYVRDLTPPPGVEFRLGPDTPVVAVHAPMEFKEAAPAEAAAAAEGAPAEPELIRRKPAEEGEEEEEEGEE